MGELISALTRNVRNPLQVFQHLLDDEPIRIFRFPGFSDVVFVGDYEIARKLLVDPTKVLERDGVATGSGSRAYGKETPFVGGQPEVHTAARKYAQSAFTPRAVYTPEITHTMEVAAKRLSQSIRDHLAGENGDRPLELQTDMKGAALYAMLRGVFGYEASAKNIKDHIWPMFAEINQMVLFESVFSTVGLKLGHLPKIFPFQRRIAKALREVDSLVDEIIANARRPDAPKDFLFYDLVRDPKVPEEYLRAIIKTSVAGAMETSASYVTWALDSVARQPAAAAEIRAEIKAVVGDGPILVEHLPRLPKLAAFIKESGRQYTPFHITPRRLAEDITIETKSQGKITLKKGSQIWISLYKANHDPLVWDLPGAAPADQFDPGRFLVTGAGLAPEPLTFGRGKHACLGIHLAHLEAMVFTGELIRNFEMAPGRAKPPVIESGLTTKPAGGLVVQFKDLKPKEGGR